MIGRASSSATNSVSPAQKPSVHALLQLAPYLLRYKPGITAALLAVTVAAAATLAVPLAIRRMIDFGFSAESAGLINYIFSCPRRRRRDFGAGLGMRDSIS